jgi:hypothetical protein
MLSVSLVSHKIRVTKKRVVMGTKNPPTQVEWLATVIVDYWAACMSDSGHVWEKAARELAEAVGGVQDGVRRDAYNLAYMMTLSRGER